MKKFILAVWVMLSLCLPHLHTQPICPLKKVSKNKMGNNELRSLPKIMIIGLSITAAIILVTVIIGITYSRRETNE